DYPFAAEGILRRIVDLLLLDARLIWDEEKAKELKAAVQLTFRDTRIQPYDVKATGLPKFEQYNYTEKVNSQKDQRFQISLGGRSAGGSSKGVIVDISGSALDENLVALNQFMRQGVSLTPVQTLVDKHIHIRLNFEDVIIPAGISDMAAYYVLFRQSPSHRDIAMSKLNETIFYVFFEGRGLRNGSGTIIIKMIPLENSEEGVLINIVPITIGQ
ncbi:MAG: hypothetical protein ABI970_23960, partial [Chloroflexota bacterium]